MRSSMLAVLDFDVFMCLCLAVCVCVLCGCLSVLSFDLCWAMMNNTPAAAALNVRTPFAWDNLDLLALIKINRAQLYEVTPERGSGFHRACLSVLLQPAI